MASTLSNMGDIERLDVNATGESLAPLRVLIGKNTLLAPQVDLPDGRGTAGDAFLVRMPRAITIKLKKAKPGQDKVTARHVRQ